MILIAPNWPTQLGSRTRQSCWWHRPDRSPSGRICYLRWAARGGTQTRSCGAFMCGCFGDIRGAEVCPVFWVIDLTWCECSDSVCPVRALRIYIDRSASFRQSDQLSCVLRWLCKRPYQNRGFPLDCGRYHGCLYEPRFGMPLSH